MICQYIVLFNIFARTYLNAYLLFFFPYYKDFAGLDCFRKNKNPYIVSAYYIGESLMWTNVTLQMKGGKTSAINIGKYISEGLNIFLGS